MSDLSASALEPVQDMIAHLWHSDASDEFEKVIDILSLLIPMFPLLFISTDSGQRVGSGLTV